MKIRHICILTLCLLLFAGIGYAKKGTSIPETQKPEVVDPSSPLSVDHLLGVFTFAQPRPDTFVNGYVEFFPDHRWTMVVHFDDDRDRITDRKEIRKGEFEVRKINDAPRIVITEEGLKDETVTDISFQDGKIKNFKLRNFEFRRRVGDMPYFDHSLNVPVTAQELKITTKPAGAVVYLDGVRVQGNTPLVVLHPPAGRPMEIRIEMVDHSPRIDKVELAEGESKSLSYSLVEGEAEFWISTKPWTKVYIDGKYHGNAPTRIRNLTAGLHQVRLENSGANIMDEFEIELPEGGIVKDIRKYTGKLDIYVGRTAKIVDKDGKVIGQAPIRNLELPVGNHPLRLVDPNTKKKKIILVKIRLNETTVVNEDWNSLKDL